MKSLRRIEIVPVVAVGISAWCSALLSAHGLVVALGIRLEDFAG